MTLTRRAVWLAGAAATVTLFVPTLVGVLLLTAVVAAAVADAWTVRDVPSITRTAPPILSRGVPAQLTVVAASPQVTVRQPVASPDLRVDPAQAAGTLVAGIVATRRGSHRLGPVASLRVGPLGLGGWYHRTGGFHEITVYPDLPAAQRLATEVRLGMFREEGRRARGPLGLGTELESVRDYQPDDDIRQVNWRATVRTGRPMSNIYRIEQDRDVLCLIDCGRLMSAPVVRDDGVVLTRLDAAVDAVAALAAVADEMGDRIGVVAFADRILTIRHPRRDAGRLVIDAIHELEPQGVDSDYEAAAARVTARKRSFVLVLTDLLDPVATHPLRRAVPTIARHHAVTIATTQDPSIEAALAMPASDDNELARSIVAADVALGRRRTVIELEGAGATVIDAPVESLSRRCVSAYLSAKRLARV